MTFPCLRGGMAGGGNQPMDFEKFTDRARGFVQSAQSLALREGHQQFAPEHLLKVLLDDPEGLAAGLIDRSGRRAAARVAPPPPPPPHPPPHPPRATTPPPPS